MPDFPATNQGRAIVTKATPHIAVNTAPDVCKTPPKGDPKPFPNHVTSDRLVYGTTTVLIARKSIWTWAGQLGPPSEPPHEGVLGGVTSHTHRAEAWPKTCSNDCIAEGFGVVRTDDETWQNKANTNGKVVRSMFYFGLFSPASMLEFCKAWCDLRKKWASLTPAQRVAAMRAAINAQLAKSGVPAPSFNVTKMNGPDGTFDWTRWQLSVNEDRITSTPTDKQWEWLGDVLYHEARHAEQFWYLARTQAAAQAPGPWTPPPLRDIQMARGTYSLASQYNLPYGIAFQAMQQPLSDNSPGAQLGWGVQYSCFGAGAANRGQTLTGLSQTGDQLRAIDAELRQLREFVGPLTDQQQARLAALEAQRPGVAAQNGKFYQGYRSLVEEKDAWDVGTAFEASCRC